MILTIEAWMDGYDSEDQMNEAIREYLPECFNMTAAHLTIVEHPDTVKLKELQDAVMALLLDIDNAYVEVDGEHVEPIMSTEAYNLVREVLKDVQK